MVIFMALYKVSKKVQSEALKMKQRGYKIVQTTDSMFLHRKPMNRKNRKRIGKKIGTGGGVGISTSVFAYKEIKIK